MMRKRPGRTRRAGNGAARREIESLEPREEVGEQGVSPPKRWAQPVMSRKKPSPPFSGPQGETAGV